MLFRSQVLELVSGQDPARDRDAEFRTRADSAQRLLDALDNADALVDELVPKLTPQQLEQPLFRNDLTLAGARWLVRAFGHVREHAAHAELTRQLLLAGRR